MIFRKIEQDNCFIIQQIVNEKIFVARKRLARFRTNLGNLRISQDICHVRMTDNNGFLTIYGHRASLLNKKIKLSFNTVFSFFSLAENLSRDLQITA